jgi:hypothetical protein
MSAYIVDKRIIDALVTVAYYGPKNELPVAPWNVWGGFRPHYMMQDIVKDDMTPDELGRILWQTNHDSVNARYDEDTLVPEYTFERVPIAQRPTAAQTINILSCYEYQSCEHDEWIGSPAFLFCVQLLSKLVNRMPDVRNAANWGGE